MPTNANKRVVAFQLKVEALGNDIKSLDDIKNRVKELNKERSLLNTTTEEGKRKFEALGNELAKLKGVQAQERAELRKQVKSFQLLGENVDVAKGSIRDLQQQQKEIGEQLRRSTRGVSIAADEYDQLEQQYKDNAVAIADFNRNLSASNQLVGEYDKGILNALKNFGGFDQLSDKLEGLNKKQAQLNDRGKELQKEYKRLEKTGGDAFEAVKKELVEVDKELKDVNGSIQDVEGALKDVEKQAGGIKGAIKGVGALVVAEFTVDKVIQFLQVLNETQQQLNKLNADVTRTFNISSTAAGQLATQMKAVSDSIDDVDIDTVFEAARNGAIAFNEPIEKTNEVIKELLIGATNTGEALDQFREYSPVLNEVFKSSEQVAASILFFERIGVPLDKGADALKEFNLRITEQSKATRTALENAFGGAFTDKLLNQVKKGEISISEALQRVGTELKTANVNATDAQAVIANVFGSPGEDAGGREFVERLADANFNLKELTNTGTTYEAQKREEIRLNEELTAQMVRLNSQFGIQGENLTNLTLSIQVGLLGALNKLVEVFNTLAVPFNKFNELSGALAQNIASLFGVVQDGQDAFDPSKSLYDLIDGYENLDGKVKGLGDSFRFYESGAKKAAKETEEAVKKSAAKQVQEIDRIRLALLEFSNDIRESSDSDGINLGAIRINASESIDLINSQIEGIKRNLSTEEDEGKRLKLLLDLENAENAAEKIKTQIDNIVQSIAPEGVETLTSEGITIPLNVQPPEGLGETLKTELETPLDAADLLQNKLVDIADSAIEVGEATGIAANAFGSLAGLAKEGTAAYEGFTKAAQLFAAAQQVAAQVSFIAGIAKSVAGGPLGFLNALKIAASVASILATVKGAFANFEEGGSLSFIDNPQLSKGNRGMIGGKRHRQGGSKGFYQGRGFEIEQGESLNYVGGVPFILSRKAMSLPDVQALVKAADFNFPTFESGGSLNVLAAERSTGGGSPIVVNNQGLTAAEVAYLIDRKVAQIQVVNVATETTAVSEKSKQVRNEFGI